MNDDARYAEILNQMDDASAAALPMDWSRLDELVRGALALVDRSGQGHGRIGIALSEALHAIEDANAPT